MLTAPGIIYLVGAGGVPAELEDLQIETLRQIMTPHNACPTNYLGPGDRVHFWEGPFAGLEGTIIRSKGQTRFVVSVDLIMRSISIEVDRANLDLACTYQSSREHRAPLVSR